MYIHTEAKTGSHGLDAPITHDLTCYQNDPFFVYYLLGDWLIASTRQDTLPSLAVAIVSYNTRSHLQACLETVEVEGVKEVVVVDNASSDASVDMVMRCYPWVKLVVNPDNPGYGVACNQAAGSCTADYILFLNSDTRLQPGVVRALGHYLDEQQNVGIVAPRLLNPDGTLQRSCFAFPTPLHYLLSENRLAQLVGRLPLLRDHILVTWPHNEARAVPWVLGAALAVRRDAFEEVGGFAPSFFMYFEEVDLCYRLHAAGWACHFLPDATIVHLGGASTVQKRAMMAVQLYRSLFHFYDRHYSPQKKAQLRWVLSYIMLRNIVRESLQLPFARRSDQQARLLDNLAIWKQVLKDAGGIQ